MTIVPRISKPARRHGVSLRILLLLGFGIPCPPVQAGQPPEDPPRLQWREEGGYCGEASIQTMALRFGLWVSQGEVRRLAGGEVLLGDNVGRALDKLELRFDAWEPRDAEVPRLPVFLRWLEGHLKEGHPCMVGVYVAGGTHREYDHIVPVLGVRPAPERKGSIDGKDAILFHSLFGKQPIWKKVADLGIDRSGCSQGLQEAGNLPRETLYGVALLGPRHGRRPLVSIRLDVDRAEEPNPFEGQMPCGMGGTVTISGLVPGAHYVIQRRDRGGKGGQTLGTYATCHAFVATRPSERWPDPKPIPSDGVTQYRVVLGGGTP